MAKTSFLLPVYNSAEYLSQTLDSVLSQTNKDFDVVIVDDGSTDETPTIIDKIKDKRIRYYAKDNGGLVSALNFGIEMLDCEFVARVDSDDICFPNRIESQLEFMEFTGAIASSCKALNIDQSGNLLGISAPELDFFTRDARFIPAREPYLPHPFLTVTLEALKSIGGFRNAHLAEDTDLCWRLHAFGRTSIQREILGKYRVHQNSVSVGSLEAVRVQAFYSQLASLNSLRENEIVYKHTLSQAKAQAKTFDSLLNDYIDDLIKDEISHLRAASAMKYLDIANWRQLNVTVIDLTFARNALKSVNLTKDNQWKIEQIFHSVQIRQPDLFNKRRLFWRKS